MRGKKDAKYTIAPVKLLENEIKKTNHKIEKLDHMQ